MSGRTFTAASRVCLSGEDLDWLGGTSVCVGIDLNTNIEIGGVRTSEDILGWSRTVWIYLLNLGLVEGDQPPPVRLLGHPPIASGLSSSSSLVIALIRAFLDSMEVDDADILRFSFEIEHRIMQGGGMDQTSIIYGGVNLTSGIDGSYPQLLEQRLLPVGWRLVILDSRIKKSTKNHIAVLRQRQRVGDERLSEYLVQGDKTSRRLWDALNGELLNDVQLMMHEAHGLMRDLQGMSTETIEDLKNWADKTLGLPFKLTGAGGGGSLVGICEVSDAPRILRMRGQVRRRNAELYVVDASAIRSRARV